MLAAAKHTLHPHRTLGRIRPALGVPAIRQARQLFVHNECKSSHQYSSLYGSWYTRVRPLPMPASTCRCCPVELACVLEVSQPASPAWNMLWLSARGRMCLLVQVQEQVSCVRLLPLSPLWHSLVYGRGSFSSSPRRWR